MEDEAIPPSTAPGGKVVSTMPDSSRALTARLPFGMDVSSFRATQSVKPWRPYRTIVGGSGWSSDTRARADQTIEEWVWEYTTGLPRRTTIDWDSVTSLEAPEVYLHAWEFLEPVLQTYERTRVFDYLDFAIQIALNWSRQQPAVGLQSPSPWYDAAVGIRVHRLAYVTDAAARRENISDQIVERLAALTHGHAETLANDDRFAADADYGLYVVVGQLASARRLSALPEMERVQEQAVARLNQLIGRHAGDDDISRHPYMQRALASLVESGLLEEWELTRGLEKIVPYMEGDRQQEHEVSAQQRDQPAGEVFGVGYVSGTGATRESLERQKEKYSRMMRASLPQLGRKHGTDKTGHGYLPHYEDLLEPIRDDEFEMLEIGVHEGASIRMWHEYFSAAQIVGVDSKAIVLKDDLPRYTFVQGSQADWTFLNKLGDKHSFRLMIDDGSHFWGHQIFTFQMLFPRLETGGIYVCEDIQTSYGEPADRYHGGAKESAGAYFFRLAQALVAGRSQEFKQVEDPMMHFFLKKIRSMMFIRHAVIIIA